jgi:hypothetical protein
MKRHIELQLGSIPLGNDGIEQAEPVGQIGGKRQLRPLDFLLVGLFNNNRQRQLQHM